MDFYTRATANPTKLAILPGAFHPPTRAHLAMAEASLALVDEVLFVLPRAFPHKEYSAAGFDARLTLLRAAISGNPRFSLAASARGLFIDLAREARVDYGSGPELFLLCGRDAAERIVSWDYGEATRIEQQLDMFQLLVASRDGRYKPPPQIRERVVSIEIALDEISSSEVRRRIRSGEPWRELVPDSIARLIEARSDLWSSE